MCVYFVFVLNPFHKIVYIILKRDGYNVFVKICLSIFESISKDDMTELTFNGWLVK